MIIITIMIIIIKIIKIKIIFEAGDKWYEHEPESVFENEDCKILWDFSIKTDHVIETRLGFS